MKSTMKTLALFTVIALSLIMIMPITKATATKPTTVPHLSTTINPPTPFNPQVVCGSQTIKPPANIHTQLGYSDGVQESSGHGLGFKDPYWKQTTLPEITLNGTLEIYESDNVQEMYVEVFSNPDENKQGYKVEELANLEPGRYIVECKANVWGEASAYGTQKYNIYVYAFALIVPDPNAPSTPPATTVPTSIAVTTQPQSGANVQPAQSNQTQGVDLGAYLCWIGIVSAVMIAVTAALVIRVRRKP